MKPSDETIEKFRKAYCKEFGAEISRDQAYEKFLRLVNVLRVVLREREQKAAFDHPLEDAKLKTHP